MTFGFAGEVELSVDEDNPDDEGDSDEGDEGDGVWDWTE